MHESVNSSLQGKVKNFPWKGSPNHKLTDRWTGRDECRQLVESPMDLAITSTLLCAQNTIKNLPISLSSNMLLALRETDRAGAVRSEAETVTADHDSASVTRGGTGREAGACLSFSSTLSHSSSAIRSESRHSNGPSEETLSSRTSILADSSVPILADSSVPITSAVSATTSATAPAPEPPVLPYLQGTAPFPSLSVPVVQRRVRNKRNQELNSQSPQNTRFEAKSNCFELSQTASGGVTRGVHITSSNAYPNNFSGSSGNAVAVGQSKYFVRSNDETTSKYYDDGDDAAPVIAGGVHGSSRTSASDSDTSSGGNNLFPTATTTTTATFNQANGLEPGSSTAANKPQNVEFQVTRQRPTTTSRELTSRELTPRELTPRELYSPKICVVQCNFDFSSKGPLRRGSTMR